MTLAANTLAFAIAFAAWVALGPAARSLGAELGLGDGDLAWMRALPILVGATLRLPMGVLTDHLGARITFPALLWIGSAAMVWLSLSTGLPTALLSATALGAVGATFAVGVQSVSAATPSARHGVALGVFGAANIGSALTTFGMPLLLGLTDWRGAMQLYAAVLAATGVAYAVAVRGVPCGAASLATRLAPLRHPASWRFGLYYMATFGAFVAVTLVANDLYIDAHGLSPTAAGAMATTFTVSSSLARIPGGWLADRLGGARVLRWALALVGLALAPLGQVGGLAPTVGLVFLSGLAMGVGMAAVYQLIPDRFPTAVGAAGGVVGSLGGLAGFYLPLVGSWLGRPLLPVGLLAATALATHLLWDGQVSPRPRSLRS